MWLLADNSLKGVRYFRKWLDLEECVPGHSENEEMAFVWVELGHRYLLFVVRLDQLSSQKSI